MVFETVLQFSDASLDLFPCGYAIHGSYEINRLGGPASYGCIRLHPANAAALFELVKSLGATTIVVSGSNPVIASAPAPSPSRYGGWGGSRYDNRYRPDYGQSPSYYWRPEPGIFPTMIGTDAPPSGAFPNLEAGLQTSKC